MSIREILQQEHELELMLDKVEIGTPMRPYDITLDLEEVTYPRTWDDIAVRVIPEYELESSTHFDGLMKVYEVPLRHRSGRAEFKRYAAYFRTYRAEVECELYHLGTKAHEEHDQALLREAAARGERELREHILMHARDISPGDPGVVCRDGVFEVWSKNNSIPTLSWSPGRFQPGAGQRRQTTTVYLTWEVAIPGLPPPGKDPGYTDLDESVPVPEEPDDYELVQTRTLNAVFEIGAVRRYYIPGRTIGQPHVGRVQYHLGGSKKTVGVP